ncbi:phage virion morphogenesis protein [Verminephrobacter aporrectodeae]|uniref:phage virion morphogenesis protein n=1 Tax=Verminephrobacter aporrectodeae TaxID=1110389 RepID=UPI002242C89F|nr:phage virion morphogenesis protein [Verminephrobacter aporrectodeae]MCW8175264.1 phage virion morphogenesis protein [Verminephrobacter aporrectodeae subsp. tuberculatae]MCW8202749.1 phage virion morphogenesis protein [Verminephrobacter aporrectodeae subsp. tuberculatae]
MLEIKLDTNQALPELQALQRRISHPSRLMAGIAKSLESQAQQAFQDQGLQGEGKWAALSVRTIAERTRGRRGKNPEPASWPGAILNRSGGRGLVGSLMSASSATTATVGAGSAKSAAYAAIHQFGGKAGRSHRVTIPARPYLPMRMKGSDLELTPKASASILGLMRDLVEGKLG